MFKKNLLIVYNAVYNILMMTSEYKDQPITILLLEDNEQEAYLVQQTLKVGWKAAVTVHHYLNVEEAVSYLDHKTPDIILTDLNVLDSDGLNTVESIVRANHNKAPIIVITSMKDQKNAISALGMGAQEFVVKGEYSAESLATAIRFAKARSQSTGANPIVKSGEELGLEGLSIDFMAQAVTYFDGLQRHKIDLTPMELKVAAYFMKYAGRELSRDELRENVWGEDVSISDRVIDNQVSRLRTKIKNSGYHIQSVRSVGYRFEKLA